MGRLRNILAGVALLALGGVAWSATAGQPAAPTPAGSAATPGQSAATPDKSTVTADKPAADDDAKHLQVVWKLHDDTFAYHSRSTLYTCEGLRDKVAQILQHYGARRDIQVTVASCGFQGYEMVANAFVRVRYYAAATIDDNDNAPQVVSTGEWRKVTIAPGKPLGLARSECDIVESMRDILKTGFEVQDPAFNLSCYGGGDLGTFSVTATVLRQLPGTEQLTGAPAPGARPRLPGSVSIQEYNYLADAIGPLQATLYRPKTSEIYPLLIYVHGGEFVRGDRSAAAYVGVELARRGVAVLAVDFRMPPQAGYPVSIAEINYAIRWAKQQASGLGTRPDWIGLYGESSGAHQALLAALRPDDEVFRQIPMHAEGEIDAHVGYVVACWPVLDPGARLAAARSRGESGTARAIESYFDGGQEMLDQARLTGAGMPGKNPPSLLLVQGDADEYVNFHQAESFVDDYRRNGGMAELLLFKGQAHGFMRAPFDATSQDALAKIIRFVVERTKNLK